MMNSIVNKLHLNKTVKNILSSYFSHSYYFFCLLASLSFYSLSEQSSKICGSEHLGIILIPSPHLSFDFSLGRVYHVEYNSVDS